MGMHMLVITLLLMGFFPDFSNGECKPNDFTCANGRCIKMGWKCDRSDDCHDNSDEADCPATTCSEGYFRCDSGQCIPQRWTCDESADCKDKSDEKAELCANKTCDGYKCAKTDTCIPNTWTCDGQEDCRDGDDEKDCPTTCDPKTEFKCKDNKCISLQWRCDHNADCDDKSDEADCPHHECEQSEWKCANGECIAEMWKCDGDTDCEDESDEASCPVTNQTCESNQFKCHTPVNEPQCIHISWKCDGENDCIDGSDEDCGQITCPPGEKMCGENYCIMEDFFCDGQKDCTDGSDEVNCTYACQENQFDCYGDGKRCIEDTKKCNGMNDCDNFKDESPAICDRPDKLESCSVENGNCSQICVLSQEDPSGRVCECEKGYKLKKGSETECEDINECEDSSACSQLCENTKGSFKCECEHGYDLSEGRYCKAINASSAELFLSDSYDLRRYKLNTYHYTLLLEKDVSGAVAMDFDIRTHMLYWTDINLKAVSTVNLETFERGKILEDQVSTPDGLAVDWIHKNLYISDTGLDVIMVTTLDGKHKKTLVTEDLDEPRALVVDPYQGWMYWTDWGSVAKIEKCGMNGKDRKTIVSDHVQWPNGLTIDYVGRRLYWVDAKLHIIGSSDLEGNDYRLILKSYSTLGHPFAVTVFEDYLFWTDWMDNAVHKYLKFGNGDKNVTTVALKLKDPMDIRIYHIFRQPASINRCGVNNGGCSHLCLPKPEKKGSAAVSLYECACPDGMALQGLFSCIASFVPPVITTSKPLTVKPDVTSAQPTAAKSESTTAKPEPTTTKLEPITAKPKPTDASVPYIVHTSEQPEVTTGAAKNGSDSELGEEDKGEHFGHIAFITIGVVLGVALIVFMIIFALVRNYKKKNVKSMNFDNPVYRKTTTDDQLIMGRSSRSSLPPSHQPLNQDPEIV